MEELPLSDQATTPIWVGSRDTVELGQVSLNEAALKSIRARAILVPCSNDLYFPPEDNAIEAAYMPHAQLRIFDSPWGHCVANPGNEPRFQAFLDACIGELLM